MALFHNFRSLTRHKQILNSIFIKCFHRSSYLLGCNGENVKEALFIPFQKEPPKLRRKVSVIGGAGQTGVAMAYTLLIKNYCDEIVMFDRKEAKIKLCAEALDFLHGTSVHLTPRVSMSMDMEDTKNSDLIIFNSGMPTKPGQSRLEVAQDNICHFKEVVPCLAQLSPDCVMLVVTNPADLMSYTCWKYSCLDKNRILGAGCELDSSRFRYHISKRLGINPRSIGGWVIGEHGDSSVPAWSTVNVAGTKLKDIDPCIGTCGDKNNWNKLHKQVVRDGLMLVEMKGWTQYGIAQAMSNVAAAVLSNARTVHCVSTQIKGLYGVETECFLAMPCIIGNKGVSEIIQLTLDDEEIEKLTSSACVLDQHMKKMKFP